MVGSFKADINFLTLSTRVDFLFTIHVIPSFIMNYYCFGRVFVVCFYNTKRIFFNSAKK